MDENKIIDLAVERKKQYMTEFVDLMISNATKYFLEHEEEIRDAVCGEGVDELLDRYEDETGRDFTEDFEMDDEMIRTLMEHLVDRLNELADSRT